MSTAVTAMPRSCPAEWRTVRRTWRTRSGSGWSRAAARVMVTRTPVPSPTGTSRQVATLAPGTASAARRSTFAAALSAMRGSRPGRPGQQPSAPYLRPDDVHDACGEREDAGRVLGVQCPGGRAHRGQSLGGLAAVRAGEGVRVGGRHRVPGLFPGPAQQPATGKYLITLVRRTVGGGRFGRPRPRAV
ncbi:hypothetical protein ACFQ3Z_24095 [Streptomyces nogalater]